MTPMVAFCCYDIYPCSPSCHLCLSLSFVLQSQLKSHLLHSAVASVGSRCPQCICMHPVTTCSYQLCTNACSRLCHCYLCWYPPFNTKYAPVAVLLRALLSNHCIPCYFISCLDLHPLLNCSLFVAPSILLLINSVGLAEPCTELAVSQAFWTPIVCGLCRTQSWACRVLPSLLGSCHFRYV